MTCSLYLSFPVSANVSSQDVPKTVESNDSKINDVQPTVDLHEGEGKQKSTTHVQTHLLSTSKQFSSNDCAPLGSCDSSADPSPHDGSKAPPVYQNSSGDQTHLAEGTRSDHSKNEAISVSGCDNAHDMLQDSSSGVDLSSHKDKTVSQKRSREGAALPVLDSSSPSGTIGADSSSGAVEHQQQAHNVSADGQHCRKQNKLDKPAADMKQGVSYIEYSFMRIIFGTT